MLIWALPCLRKARMSDDYEPARYDWRIPTALWERIELQIPPLKSHPLGCHRPSVDDR
jgi:hypothetical protein